MPDRKNVLILGGTSDIGIAIALHFGHRGFNIWLAGRDMDFLRKVAADLHIRTNASVSFSVFEVQDYSSHAEIVASGTKADVCICVFGYLGNQQLAERNWEEAGRIIDVNYRGAVSILNLIAEDFAKRKCGTIIGISSVAGDRGRSSNYIYGSAKAGFTAYLSGLRGRLFRDGVHVMTVKPGFVATRMTEGLPIIGALTVSADRVAAEVFNGYSRGKNVLYTSGSWYFIMRCIGLIPEFLFKRLAL